MEGPFVHLRTYQAYSMAEALTAVKRELGADAVILGTRTFRRRGFLWIGGRTIVEVTAASASEAAQHAGGRSGRAPSERTDAARGAGSTGRADGAGELRPGMAAVPAAALRARAAYGAATVAPTGHDGQHQPDPIPDEPVDPEADRMRTRRLAQAMLEQHERRTPAETPIDGAHEGLNGQVAGRSVDAPRPRSAPRREPREAEPGGRTRGPESGRESNATAPSNGPVRGYAVKPTSSRGDEAGAAAGAGSRESGPPPDRLEGELAALRSMVGQVLRGQARGSAPARSLPPQLFDWYLRLIGQEMSEELADRIMSDVRTALSDDAMNDPDAVREAIRERIIAFLPACGARGMEQPPRGRPGHPFKMVLVGPTGVGKTTTVAKLAATFKLRFGHRVGLITGDTYRIAAVDQLRTYAGIIGVELRVALTPRDMREAMQAMQNLDVVIVDTAGRSQNDVERIRELATMVEAAEPDEVHLVLSGTAGERVLMREAEAFGRIGIDRILLTKLDEAVGFGMLISVVHKLGKSISFLSAGQEVPQHIEAGDPLRLADLLLQEEEVAS